MNLKMIMALVSDEKTDTIVDAARDAGATGATVITNVRGEGLTRDKSFFGLDITSQRDVILFLVESHKVVEIMNTIDRAGRFDEEPGTGIAVQWDIEDAIGLKSQTSTILHEIEDKV